MASCWFAREYKLQHLLKWWIKRLIFKEFLVICSLKLKRPHYAQYIKYVLSFCGFTNQSTIWNYRIKPIHMLKCKYRFLRLLLLHRIIKWLAVYFTLLSTPYYKIISDNPCIGCLLLRVERKNAIHTISDEDLNKFLNTWGKNITSFITFYR